MELSRPVIYVPVVAVAPIGTDWIEHKVKVCTIALDHVLLPLLPVLTDIARAATSIGNTDFLSVTDFFAQKGGKLDVFR